MPGSTPSLPAMSDDRPASSAATTPVPLYFSYASGVPDRRGDRDRRSDAESEHDRSTGAQPLLTTIARVEGHDRGSSTSTTAARATQGEPLTGQTARRHRAPDARTRRAPRRVHVIRDGLAAHLPDIDPEETAEWLDSFDAVLDARRPAARPLPDAAACCSAPASATSACRR